MFSTSDAEKATLRPTPPTSSIPLASETLSSTRQPRIPERREDDAEPAPARSRLVIGDGVGRTHHQVAPRRGRVIRRGRPSVGQAGDEHSVLVAFGSDVVQSAAHRPRPWPPPAGAGEWEVND